MTLSLNTWWKNKEFHCFLKCVTKKGIFMTSIHIPPGKTCEKFTARCQEGWQIKSLYFTINFYLNSLLQKRECKIWFFSASYRCQFGDRNKAFMAELQKCWIAECTGILPGHIAFSSYLLGRLCHYHRWCYILCQRLIFGFVCIYDDVCDAGFLFALCIYLFPCCYWMLTLTPVKRSVGILTLSSSECDLRTRVSTEVVQLNHYGRLYSNWLGS